MVKRYLLSCATVLALAVGCDSSNESEDENPGTDSNTIPSGVGVLSGVVTDQSGIPVEGVSIKVGDASVKTDESGRFSVEAEPGSQVVRFSKKGYAESSMAVSVTDGADTSLQEGLLKRNAPIKTNIDSGETVGENARVTLKSGALVTEDGAAAKGEVSAYITPIDVMGNLTVAPGDFSATDQKGEAKQIETYGMADYYFEDGDGKPLNVADGEKVEIELAVPSELDAEEGDIIPAWHFDVDTGKWVEDGEGEVVDDGNGGLVWRAEVSHFSTWNADKPINEHDCVSGVITDCNGKEVQGATVTANGINYRGASSAYPGSSGSYCVDIKRGAQADVLVVGTVEGNKVGKRAAVVGKDAGASCSEGTDGCLKQHIKLPCDPAESDLDCGDSPDLPCKACISGRIVTADGDGIEDAVVSFSNDDNGYGGRGMNESGGGFCLPAPLNVPMTLIVNAAGYPPTSVTATATKKGECPDCTDVGDIVLEKGGDDGATILEQCNETELTVDSVDLDGADDVLSNLPYMGMLVYSAGEGESSVGYLWMSNSDNPDDPTGASSIFTSFEIPAGAAAGESGELTGMGTYNANGVIGVNSEMYIISGTLTWNEAVDGPGQTLTGNWSFEMTTYCGMALRTMTFEGSFSTDVMDVMDLISDENQCLDELGKYMTGSSEITLGMVTLEVNGEDAASSAQSSAFYYPGSGLLGVSTSDSDGYSMTLMQEGPVFGTQDISQISLDDSTTSCTYGALGVPELAIDENDASDLSVAPIEGTYSAELAPSVGDCTDNVSITGTFIAAICAE